eukprot:GILK01006434.1.p1 GENE.GILK01006434.1~~GILK01006434.1.p1  ORF type:complete len:228 (-),score=24.46 GILK01006434.1:111-725(-)
MAASRRIVIDPFCYKQFDDPNYGGTRINCPKAQFEAHVNEYYTANPTELSNGYAPFCKHLFIPNFTGAKVGSAPITEHNRHLLRSGYQARTPKELPVLKRWFPASMVDAAPGKYLDVILYSKEQIQKECAAMQQEDPNKDVPYEYGVVSIKAQDINTEQPMEPITMMRNALGVSEGGSGVTLDKSKYAESVAFWEVNAIIQPDS